MNTPDLDAMLLGPDAAEWLHLSERELSVKSKGRNPRIPAFRINQRVVRYNPRIIIAKMARDAGVTPEVIAASFGMRVEKKAE